MVLSKAQNTFLTEVDSNGRATIKAIVPNASSVKIIGLGGSYGLYNLNLDFTNKGNNLWEVTLDPAIYSYVTPGFHYYNFQVNGVNTVNPNEKTYFGASFWTSGLEIPDPKNDFYNIKDVPHGTIRMQLYNSTVTNNVRRCFIYLPPGYDTKSDEKYPVLFLQHGMNENEFSWHMQGKINFILDNLIAEGKALPMIVVMDNGMSGDYSSLVLKDLLPLVQNNYKIIKDKKSRAVAGLSMGSGQAADLGMTNSDKFGYIGVFSGSSNVSPTTIAKTVNLNDSLVLLWVGWGKDDELIGWETTFESQLNKARINHVKEIFDGGHQWQVWRKCLYEFAQLLFKPYTYENPFNSLNNINPANNLIVYPNPFNGEFHLKMDNDNLLENARYELHRITGEKILTLNGERKFAENTISETLAISSFNVFLLTVYTKDGVYNAKIIK